MTDARYNYLMNDDPTVHWSPELTDEEIEEGWHFCPEWDGLLIGPGMMEWEEHCECL